MLAVTAETLRVPVFDSYYYFAVFVAFLGVNLLANNSAHGERTD